MTENERIRISEMRASGRGYARIADALDMSINSVKSYCRRHSLSKSSSVPDRRAETHAEEPAPSPAPCEAAACEQCGSPVLQAAGRKHRRFCSDACRQAWWTSHRSEMSQTAVRHFVCENCGMQFSRYGVSDRRFAAGRVPPSPAGGRRLTMTHDVLLMERRYLACLSLLKTMKERALLTDAEYARARQLLIARYQPKI